MKKKAKMLLFVMNFISLIILYAKLMNRIYLLLLFTVMNLSVKSNLESAVLIRKEPFKQLLA